MKWPAQGLNNMKVFNRSSRVNGRKKQDAKQDLRTTTRASFLSSLECTQ